MKARENRKRRLKRDRKELERLALKRCAPLAYRQAGKGPPYYRAVLAGVAAVVKNGRRDFHPKKTAVRVVPTAKYHDLMRQLLRLTEGVTWTIPPDLLVEVRAAREAKKEDTTDG